jgi:RNA polymerase sigma-70 factor (ECF subfamily)
MRTKMIKIAYSYFSSESMAIDIVDEAIYKGYLKRKSLREIEYLETWMIRILINLCNNHYKKFSKVNGIDELPEESTVEQYDSLPLKIAMQKLPEKYRQVVVLKYFVGYGVAEISEITGTPQGTVATRLRKALSLLRLELQDE